MNRSGLICLELAKICPTLGRRGQFREELRGGGNNVIAVYNSAARSTPPITNAPMARRAPPRASSKTTSLRAAPHFGAFNVKTGEAVRAPCLTALRTYKVVVQDSQVMVDLDKTAAD